jgi:hypothetical protein
VRDFPGSYKWREFKNEMKKRILFLRKVTNGRLKKSADQGASESVFISIMGITSTRIGWAPHIAGIGS